MPEQIGFIRSKREIKFLILFIAARLIRPVEFETMQELVMIDPGVDFFEFSESMGSLVDTGHLSRSERERYAITAKGRENGRACEEELPFSIRLRAQELVEERNRQIRRAELVRVSSRRRYNGTWEADLELNDDSGLGLLRLTLAVPTEERAKDLVERYDAEPERFYSRLIQFLFDENNDTDKGKG